MEYDRNSAACRRMPSIWRSKYVAALAALMFGGLSGNRFRSG
jgi:hypothetical protein